MASQNIKDMKILQECLMRIFLKDTSQLVSYKAFGKIRKFTIMFNKVLEDTCPQNERVYQKLNDERFTGQWIQPRKDIKRNHRMTTTSVLDNNWWFRLEQVNAYIWKEVLEYKVINRLYNIIKF